MGAGQAGTHRLLQQNDRPLQERAGGPVFGNGLTFFTADGLRATHGCFTPCKGNQEALSGVGNAWRLCHIGLHHCLCSTIKHACHAQYSDYEACRHERGEPRRRKTEELTKR